MTRAVVNSRLAAASLADVFKAFGNRDRKSKIFKNTLPNDEKLHEYCRQVDLLNELDDFMNQIAEIPDDVVDTEENLKPYVLRKILYRLGFAYDAFASEEGHITRLLTYRNNIAHGGRSHGVDEKDYLYLEDTVFKLMKAVIELIFNALVNQEFRKPSEVVDAIE